MSEDYYIPDLGKDPVKLNIDDEERGYNDNLLSAMNSQNSLIDVVLEDKVIIKRISRDLYKSYKSAIRELINNEYTAVLKARKRGLNPHIEIYLDRVTRTLTIEGINSLGMDSSTFINVMRFLGRSGNKEGTEVGMFGMGVNSYVMLSENMIIESYSCITNEKFVVMGKSGLGYEVLPMNNHHKDTYGLKVTLSILPEISIGGVMEGIQKYAQDKDDVDIYLILEHDTDTSEHSWKKRLKSRGKSEVTKRSLESWLLDTLSDEKGVIELKYEDDDLEMYIGIVKTERHNRYRNRSIRTLLIKTPIENNCQWSFHDIDVFVNIKNERMYEPTGDRDRLRETSSELLNKKITIIVKMMYESYLNQYTEVDHWLSLPQLKWMINDIPTYNLTLDEKVVNIISLLDSSISLYGLNMNSRKTDPYRRSQRFYDVLCSLNEGTINGIITDEYQYYWMKQDCYEHYKRQYLLIPDRAYDKELMKSTLIMYGATVLKDEKRTIKRNNIDISNKSFKVHYTGESDWYYRRRYTMLVSNCYDDNAVNLGHNTVIVSKSLNVHRNLMKRFDNELRCVKMNKRDTQWMRDHNSKAIIIKDWIKNNEDKVYKCNYRISMLPDYEGQVYRIPSEITVKRLVELMKYYDDRFKFLITDYPYHEILEDSKVCWIYNNSTDDTMLLMMALYENDIRFEYRRPMEITRYSWLPSYHSCKLISEIVFASEQSSYTGINEYHYIIKAMANSNVPHDVIRGLFNLNRFEGLRKKLMPYSRNDTSSFIMK